ncbi:MAG: PAS domain-containing protein, partial [Acidobacteriota bacterium]|nr:PAS domain-containing protein [Acidobacteriota bacterium]
MAGRSSDTVDSITLLEELDRLRGRVRDVDTRLTRVRDLERQLGTAEQRFLSLLDSIRMFAVGLDRTGKISYANNYFLEVSGYALNEIRGMDWLAEFVPEAQEKLIAPLLDEMLQTGVTPRFEHPILTSDGSQRTVAWSGGWLMQDKGSPSVHISLGADVTEQRHAEEA